MTSHVEFQSRFVRKGLRGIQNRLLLEKKNNIGSTDLTVLSEKNQYFVDSNRVDAYIENGSRHRPYRSLDTALTSVLIDSNTDNVVFRLASGVYDCVVSITKATQNQSFSIIGRGLENTIIRGGALWSSTRGDVMYFRNFHDITVKNVTIQQGKYGLYTRNCRRVVVANCRFRWLGCEDNTENWNFQHTAIQRVAIWQGNSTSDGGACRIRQSEEVICKNVEVTHTLRGIRIQEANRGLISNCRTFLTAESGIYLASTLYTHVFACSNFLITGCTVSDAYNNGILLIGGENNSVQGCRVQNCANAGIQCWHVKSATINSNKVHNCNRLAHNGIGTNPGDSGGQIVFAGNTSIPTTSGYLADVSNNSMYSCNLGRNSEIIGISIESEAYPSACNVCQINNNVSDATVKLNIEENFPVTKPVSDVSSLKIGNTTLSATTTALNFVDLTSPAQAQLNTKQSTLTSPQLSVVNANTFSTSYKDKIDSNETAVNTKQASLSAPQIAVCNANPFNTTYKDTVDANQTLLSNTDATKLGYLDVGSSVQGLINAKQAVVTNNSLSISHVSGLQTALDSGGVSTGDNVIWTGAHVFQGDVSIAQPLVRAPMTIITTVNTSSQKMLLSKDVAAYLYAHPNIQSTADNTHWQLPANAEVGTRIAVFAYTGGAQSGIVKVFSNGTQKLYQNNSGTNKGSSGVVGKKNGKAYFTMIIAGTDGVWTT